MTMPPRGFHKMVCHERRTLRQRGALRQQGVAALSRRQKVVELAGSRGRYLIGRGPSAGIGDCGGEDFKAHELEA